MVEMLDGCLQLHANPLELALLRSDYMVDEPTGALLQVEINTISSSFASLSTLTSTSRSSSCMRGCRVTHADGAPFAQLPCTKT